GERGDDLGLLPVELSLSDRAAAAEGGEVVEDVEGGDRHRARTDRWHLGRTGVDLVEHRVLGWLHAVDLEPLVHDARQVGDGVAAAERVLQGELATGRVT